MSADTYRQMFSVINSLDDREHLLASIAYFTAPTLEGIKPATLLNFTKDNRNHYSLWQRYRDEITGLLGINWCELKQTEENLYVLLYRPEALGSYLQEQANKSILEEHGYDSCMDLSCCLACLKARYGTECPHEIGIFLGIPPMDIRGYIQNNGEKCLLCSYWKVYDNVGQAQCTFMGYDNARERVANRILHTYRGFDYIS